MQQRMHDSRWVPTVVPKEGRVQWFFVSGMKPPTVDTKELLAAQKKIDKGKDVVNPVAVGSSTDDMIATSELNEMQLTLVQVPHIIASSDAQRSARIRPQLFQPDFGLNFFRPTSA